ncbi:hypothetical protein GWI34_36670, partial [Actinomadura sp. DSM 109109]|nr:hypothetical protein [Actinomadura lepetitiana]
RSIIDRARSGGAAARPPVVVLGTGGSGTRAVAEVMKAAGVYLGPKQNKASDSLEFKPFLVRWSTEYLTTSRWVEAIEADPNADIAGPPPEIVADLRAAIERQRQGIPSPDALWGWKNPRTTNLLPVLNAVAPEARTAQLVRDGRDMAYSKNQNLLGDADVLTPEAMRDAPAPVRLIALWSRMNLVNLAYMRRVKGDGHLVIRYEDLCADPATHAERLLTHLGVPVTDQVLEMARETVKLAPSTGRWREAPADELEAVLRAGTRRCASSATSEMSEAYARRP